MRKDLRLIGCAATALLYFGAVVGVMFCQPTALDPRVKANPTDLAATRCDDAKAIVAALAQQQMGTIDQVCSMTDHARQASFRALMHGAIY